MIAASPAVLISFPIEGGPPERLAAEQIGADAFRKPLYRVVSVPFLAADVSYGDVVRASEGADGPAYAFTRTRSSLSAVSVRTLFDDEAADGAVRDIASRWGMRMEGSGPLRSFAGDSAGVTELVARLEILADEGWCEYAILADRREMAGADAR